MKTNKVSDKSLVINPLVNNWIVSLLFLSPFSVCVLLEVVAF